MKIKFDVRGLRRFVGVVGLCLLGGLLGGVVLGGLAWLLLQWPGGWVGAVLSLLLLAAAALAIRFFVFERKDQMQKDMVRQSKPGAPRDEAYDEAFKLIVSGEKTTAEAWLFHCEQTGKPQDNEKLRRAFNEAMRKRKKQRHEI